MLSGDALRRKPEEASLTRVREKKGDEERKLKEEKWEGGRGFISLWEEDMSRISREEIIC